MKKKRKVKKQKRIHIKLIFYTVVFLLLLTTGLYYLEKPLPSRIASTDSSKNSLQLDVFYPSQAPTQSPIPTNPSTPTNTPSTPIPTSAQQLTCGIADPWAGPQRGSDSRGCCVEDGYTGANDHCCDGVPFNQFSPEESSNARHANGLPEDPTGWCNAKPVIYLYPEKDTLVNVSVKIPGTISISIPQYPADGWKNVLAKPSGELTYQGKTYNELFYESSITPIAPPIKGFVIKSSDINDFLLQFGTQLGLKKNEAQELTSYWTPKLQSLNSSYIFVSVFDPVSKDKIDHVEISPKPDTFIQMILYFKPLQQFEQVAPLEITPAPTREGFTAVEWGGVIDRK